MVSAGSRNRLGYVMLTDNQAVFLEEIYAPYNKHDAAASQHHQRGSLVDIIFVHGLNPTNRKDHAFKTWTHSNGIFWPKDLLPVHLPNARVLIFSYNSNVAFDSSSANLDDHADTLLDKYKAMRLHSETPIIFVSHSLGGLVVKKALIRAQNNDRVYGEIRNSTYGLMFFGTPHRGGSGVGPGKIAARVARYLTGSSNNDILDTLEKDSIFSKQMADLFRAQLEDYVVVSFFETKKWRIQKYGLGLGTIVVPKESATLGLSRQREIQLQMDADHSQMCVMAKQAIESKDSSLRRGSRPLTHRFRNETKATESQRFNTINDMYSSEQNIACLKSVAGTDQGPLIRKLCQDQWQACSWFLESTEYQMWDGSLATDVLWVTSGPGCGKTTLTAKLVEHIRGKYKIKHPGEGASADDEGTGSEILMFFFFQRANPDSEGNATAAIRTLVSQLVHLIPPLFICILRRFARIQTWSFDLLWAVFVEMLEKMPKCSKVFIILDAIDECEASSRDALLSAFHWLIQNERTEASGVCNSSLKILITSRADERIHDILSHYKSFEIKPTDTSEDMEALIRSRSRQLAAKRLLSLEIEERISSYLRENAKGMFLWVLLLFDELQRRDQRLTDDSIDSKLSKVPRTLSETYETVFRGAPKSRSSDIWRIYRWLVFGKHTMSVAQLKVALSLETDVSEWYDFAGDLRFLCGPLIRFQDEQVCLIHETVRDFVQNYASSQKTKQGENVSLESLEAENELASVCVGYMLKEDTFAGITDILCTPQLADYLREMQDFLQKKPFLSYAARYWVRHLHCAQLPRPPLPQSVIRLLEPEWRRDAITCLSLYFSGRYSMPLFPTCSSGLHLAAWYNLPWLVDLYLEQGMSANIEASSGDTPLVWASETGGLESIEKLLRAGADPNKIECDGWSALHWAATNGHEDTARRLLHAGANTDAKDSEGLCPIDWAAERGHWGVVTAIQQQMRSQNPLSANLAPMTPPLRRHSSQSPGESERIASRRPSFLVWDVTAEGEVVKDNTPSLIAASPKDIPKHQPPNNPTS